MPTYDYRCERCHEQFELWQSFNDNTLVNCPEQGGPAACEAPGHGSVKKVFSKVGIAFKGDGFYKNDHRVSATDRTEKSEATSSSKSEKSSDPKSNDSKSNDSKSNDSKSNDSKSNGTSTGSSGSDSSAADSSKTKSSDSKSVSTTSTSD